MPVTIEPYDRYHHFDPQEYELIQCNQERWANKHNKYIICRKTVLPVDRSSDFNAPRVAWCQSCSRWLKIIPNL